MASDKRILLIGGVSLVKGRIRDAGLAMVDVCDALEPLLREIDFNRSTPFTSVSLVLRFGSQRCLIPEYRSIDVAHAELPVSVELDMKTLQRMTRDELTREFTVATIEALVHVGGRFGIPPEKIRRLRSSGS